MTALQKLSPKLFKYLIAPWCLAAVLVKKRSLHVSKWGMNQLKNPTWRLISQLIQDINNSYD